MIKAIIFDCFGVLVQGSLEQFIDSNFAEDEKLVKRAHELNDQCSLGLISYEEQIAEFSEMSGLSKALVHEQMDVNPRNKQLLDYISTELKPKYMIGFLSNAGEDWLDELFTKEDLSLFDDTVLSFAVGLAKPDFRIYELSAERLNVTPDECVFIDDIERYCTSAQELGMKAIVYRTFSQMHEELEKILTTDMND